MQAVGGERAQKGEAEGEAEGDNVVTAILRCLFLNLWDIPSIVSLQINSI